MKIMSRQELSELSKRNSVYSSVKVGAYLAAILLFSALYLGYPGFLTGCLAVCGLGVVFAHGVELQHEALHGNLFRSALLNRWVGIAFGIPMLISFTHYRSYHLHHHRFVGCPGDEEIINYTPATLVNPVAFVVRAWNLLRIPMFFVNFLKMLQNEYPEKIAKQDHHQFKKEYFLLALIFTAAIFGSAMFESYIVLILWLGPWLLVSEPLHFLIEIPEHIGCDRGDPQVHRNTRSYRTNVVWGYLINHNNFHIEHHLYPAVPSHRLKDLHGRVLEGGGHCNSSYGEAVWEVAKTVRRI